MVKVKEIEITVQNASMDNVHNEQGWSDDDLDLEGVSNVPAEEVDNKLRMSLEKEFKKFFKSWRELAQGIRQAEEFPQLEAPNDSIDSLEHLLQAEK